LPFGGVAMDPLVVPIAGAVIAPFAPDGRRWLRARPDSLPAVQPDLDVTRTDTVDFRTGQVGGER
jgi:hypothetical protein